MRVRSAFAALALMVGHHAAAATEQRVSCPTAIPRTSIRIVDAPAGWVGFVPSEYRAAIPLVYAGVMVGPPTEMAELKPEGGKPDELTWSDLRPVSGGIWMACIYGDNQQHDYFLSRRLNEATKECVVKPAKQWKPGQPLEMRCR